MKSFKQYLEEEKVTLFHRTFQGVDRQIIDASRAGGKGRRPLSVFADVTGVRRYHGARTHDTTRKDGPILSTQASTRNLIPDIEWHPDAYSPIFAKVAKNLQDDPNYRPPSLTKGFARFHATVPGSRVVVDPSTGKKSIGPGWKPVWTDNQGNISDQPIKGGRVGIQNLSGRKTMTAASTGKSTQVNPETGPVSWGGSASIGGIFGERRNLDVLTRKGGLNRVMNAFMRERKKSKGFTGFQTRTGSSIGNFKTLSHADLVRMDLANRAARRKKS